MSLGMTLSVNSFWSFYIKGVFTHSVFIISPPSWKSIPANSFYWTQNEDHPEDTHFVRSKPPSGLLNKLEYVSRGRFTTPCQGKIGHFLAQQQALGQHHAYLYRVLNLLVDIPHFRSIYGQGGFCRRDRAFIRVRAVASRTLYLLAAA